MYQTEVSIDSQIIDQISVLFLYEDVTLPFSLKYMLIHIFFLNRRGSFMKESGNISLKIEIWMKTCFE